jgi:hypothetical protein
LTVKFESYYLKQSSTIRKISAAFFLLLFSFCVTPKRFLHDMLANHKDAQPFASVPLQQISQSGFRCQTDDLVVEAPFLPGIQANLPLAVDAIQLGFSEPIQTVFFEYLSDADGRGPPADFCS